ncbi:MAG: hypothetical protein KBA53_11525 [Thermoclostridium sp.]|nr:hypothetical protein [Thermoclostridium sp.]
MKRTEKVMKRIVLCFILVTLLFTSLGIHSNATNADTEHKKDGKPKFEGIEGFDLSDFLKYFDNEGSFQNVKKHFMDNEKDFNVELIKFDLVEVFYDSNGDGLRNDGERHAKDVLVSFNNAANPTGFFPSAETNSSGKAQIWFPLFSKIVYGYYVTVDIPDGYQINTVGSSLFGDDGKTGYNSITYKNNKVTSFAGMDKLLVPLIKIPEIKKANLTINSTYHHNGAALTGVEYALYTYNGTEFVVSDKAQSDSEGNVVFKDIPVDSCVYVQATNSEELKLRGAGGIGVDSFSTFIQINDENNMLSVKYYPYSSLSVQQRYLNDDEPVSTPITYELYEIQGEGNSQLIENGSTDENGKIVFTSVFAGQYVYVKATGFDSAIIQPVLGLGNLDSQSAPIEITAVPSTLDVKFQKAASLSVSSSFGNEEAFAGTITYSLYELKENGEAELIQSKDSQDGADIVFDGILVGKQVYVEVAGYATMQHQSILGLGSDDGRSAPICIDEGGNLLQIEYVKKS